MKGTLLVFLLLTASATALPAQDAARGNGAGSGSGTPALDRGKVSYAIGYQIGSQFADGKPDVDIDVLVRALQDAYAKRAPKVPVPQMREQLHTLDTQMRETARAEFRELARTNAIKARRFMEANKAKPGVVDLPSGVQYLVLRKGTGAHPTLASTVVANYRGSLINGMEFDSSYAHGHPVTFPVGKMLPGWQDVLPRMRVGAKWRVFIPPSQAYGERGQLPRIGPNEVLVFEIELLDVK